MNKQTVKDVNLNGRTVLVRCDFNVPMDKKTGKITDDKRIEATLPTIKYLLSQNCKIILCSHLGKPKGEYKQELSLKPVADELSKALGSKVQFATDTIGDSAKGLTANMQKGDIVLLENTRFDSREEKNDPEFAKELAKLAGEDGVFVNDAFGAAHRAHASTAGVAQYFKTSVAGMLMEKEIENLGGVLENPQRPFVAILGGAKVSDKIGVINNLLDKVDKLIIGGGMAYTFIKAKGYNIGNSICENDKIDLAKDLLKKAEEKNVELILPIDTQIGKEFDANTESKTVPIEEIPDGWQGLDIGEKTIEEYKNKLNGAKTVIWNGPLGVFEFPKFAVGTNEIAKYLADMKDAKRVIGGGDSASAIEKQGLSDEFDWISTGGGASLEYLEGKELPGVACLNDKQQENNLSQTTNSNGSGNSHYSYSANQNNPRESFINSIRVTPNGNPNFHNQVGTIYNNFGKNFNNGPREL